MNKRQKSINTFLSCCLILKNILIQVVDACLKFEMNSF